jgi:hypothetical protein
MREYSLLCNESETLLRLAHCLARKMSREEALNWLGVLYKLLKLRYFIGAGRTISFNSHLLPNTAKLYGLDVAAVQSASSRCQCLASDGIGKSQALAAFVHPASDHGLRRKPGHRFLGSALPIGGRERTRKPKRVDPSACTSFNGISNLSHMGLITH